MGTFSSWLKKYKGGLSYDDQDLRDYYTQYIHPELDINGTYSSNTTTSTGGHAVSIQPGTYVKTSQPGASAGMLTKSQLTNAYQSMFTNSTGSYTTANSWDRWTKEEKKALANIGFEYDKAIKSWKLKLSIDVLIPQEEGMAILMQGANDKPTDQMIERLKQAKKDLIEKLTAKIILAELTKPREIKE